jgi:hypothetical protein
MVSISNIILCSTKLSPLNYAIKNRAMKAYEGVKDLGIT